MAQTTNPDSPADSPATDFEGLRQEGIRLLQQLAGATWTDHNDHDPGITILEQLCYALTDLGYRIDYDIPDLLASSGDPARDLYTPGQVLSSEPVTLKDIRKLALDVPGVKNAWIEPVEPDPPSYRYSEKPKQNGEVVGQIDINGDPQATEPVALKGLYRVLILKNENSDGSTVARDATLRLHAHRNLCEDFAEIRVLDPTPVALQASVEIGQVDDAEQVLVEIYRAVADYLAPSVAFLTLDEMLAAGKRVDEIFEGPLLEHGFIDDESLGRLERRSVIHTSDLIRVIMGVPGVRGPPDFGLGRGGRSEPWSLDLKGGAPTLDLARSQVTLQKAELKANLGSERVNSLAVGPSADGRRDLLPPPGRDRNIARYYSIQHQFPALYGVGAMGLPDSAPPARKARAKQLKAYLMFFDQILANDFAQLAHLGDLFSFDAENAGAYFAQKIDDPALGLDDIIRPKDDAPTPNPTAAGPSLADQRRNRFLNHLLARFAEQFPPLFDVMAGQSDVPIRTLIGNKQAFLRRYPRVSGARGTASDYRKPWGAANRSGLEERVRLKLGIDEDGPEQFLLVEHILLRPMQGDEGQDFPLLADVHTRDPYSLQLSFVFPKAGRLATESDSFRLHAERTVREETPAHLTPYILWLDKLPMDAFRDAYRNWLVKLRGYWTA